MAIELDGETHYTEEAIEYDRVRDEYLEAVGIKLVRYRNQDVYENLEGVLENIRTHLI